jgi:hypothetical protein
MAAVAVELRLIILMGQDQEEQVTRHQPAQVKVIMVVIQIIQIRKEEEPAAVEPELPVDQINHPVRVMVELDYNRQSQGLQHIMLAEAEAEVLLGLVIRAPVVPAGLVAAVMGVLQIIAEQQELLIPVVVVVQEPQREQVRVFLAVMVVVE